MAWLGQKLVLCTALRYILLHPAQGTSTQLFSLAEDAPSPTLVQSIPSANLAVLLMVLVPPALQSPLEPLRLLCFAAVLASAVDSRMFGHSIPLLLL